MKIAFIGGGNMASALIAGVVGTLGARAQIHVVDPNPAQLERLAAQYPVSTSVAIDAAIGGVDAIVLAVKPQQMREVAASLRAHLAGQPLLISIAAGIRSADLARWLGDYRAIVRSMPNTPALIGRGITGMVAMAGVSAQQKAMADTIMQAVGSTVWLGEETQIDAVTAISGSGPAYVFYFIEAMEQAAAELGLSAEQGKQLALATFTGAAELAAQSSEPVALLRERVTSKGGTTHAALCSMEQGALKQGIVTAIKAAAERAAQLGDELGADLKA
jgi:pyrroline-5-carboxylate reductase